jgi:hypothetical protein
MLWIESLSIHNKKSWISLVSDSLKIHRQMILIDWELLTWEPNCGQGVTTQSHCTLLIPHCHTHSSMYLVSNLYPSSHTLDTLRVRMWWATDWMNEWVSEWVSEWVWEWANESGNYTKNSELSLLIILFGVSCRLFNFNNVQYSQENIIPPAPAPAP